MPKKSNSKNRGPEFQYDRANLEHAVRSVKDGAMSIRKAAKTFCVPKSTLHDRVTEKSAMDAHPGRKPAIPEVIENKIVESVKEASRQGIGISRKQLLVRTGELCRKFKVTPFKKLTPSKQWWEGLKKRHPELSIRRPEKLSSARASMLNPVVVQKYMDDLGNILQELDLVNQPAQIWNCDETGRNFEHTPVRVIAEKGARNVVGRTSNNRTNITIMACVNAEGKSMSPMFIAKGKTSASVHGFNTNAAPTGTKWAWQENGWINDKIGEQWFSDVFLRECGDARPQLLILDGHSSHESLAILELAKENDIHILCLPPHTTHCLQPLDRSVFGPFSAAYNTATSEYLSENPLHSVNKWSFPGIIDIAWKKAFTATNIINGFRACGIYPFNPSVIPLSSYEPSKPTDAKTVSASATIPVPSTSPDTNRLMTSGSTVFSDTASATIPVSGTFPGTPMIVPASTSSVETTSTMATDRNTLPDSFHLMVPPSTPPSDNSLAILPVSTVVFPETVSIPVTSLSMASSSVNDPMLAAESQNLVVPSTVAYESHDVLFDLLLENVSPTQVETIDTLWNTEIEQLFLPPKIVKEETTTKRKRNTSHRLLTSDDILKEKKNVQEKKDEKERKKMEREQKKLNSKI